MEFKSSQRNFSLEKAQTTHQSNRPQLRKQPKRKAQNMGRTTSSDDDDDDVMMMENSGLKRRALRDEDCLEQLIGRQNEESREEQRQDNFLKELGLYEEGMSKEQKQELIQVLEASKETAEKEETMRKRSDDWPSDVVVLNGKTRAAKESLPSSSSRSASPSQEQKKTNLVTVGDSDDDTRMTPSQDLFPSLHSEPEQQLLSREKMQDEEEDEFGSFPAGQQASESPVFRQSESVARHQRWFKLNRRRGSQQDKRTYAMETAVAMWTPQIAAAVVTSLVRKNRRNVSDQVPYFCPLAMNPSVYTKAILRNMSDYHICLQRVQRRTDDHIAWGDPIPLGKSRVVGQVRSKNVPSTSIEEPLDEQAQTLPDLDVWPVGHLEIRPVAEEKEEKPVQISGTSKKDDSAEDVFAILNRDPGSTTNEDDSSKKSSPPKNEVSDANDDGKRYVIGNTSLRRSKLSLASKLESEFEIIPLRLDDDDDIPEGVLTGGAESPTDENIPDIKPKQIRKRAKNNDLASNAVCTEKRPKRQPVKDKFSSLVKSFYIPLQRVELSEEYKLYTGNKPSTIQNPHSADHSDL